MTGVSTTQNKTANAEKSKKITFWIIVAIVAIIVAIVFSSLVGKGYVVNTDDMANTLQKGDFVFVRKISPAAQLEIGDVIVFQYPAERSQYRFGRIMAKGGSVVRIVNKRLYVDGEQIKEPKGVRFVDPVVQTDVFSLRDNFGPFEVPTNQYLILGDNRDRANDSRNWGALPRDYILGKPIFVYFAWKPDPDAPEVHSAFDVPLVIIYNITHFLNRLGFDRIATPVR